MLNRISPDAGPEMAPTPAEIEPYRLPLLRKYSG